MESNSAGAWTDPMANAALEAREDAERALQRARPNVAEAEAAARARFNYRNQDG